MGPTYELHPPPDGGDGHKRFDLQLTSFRHSSLPDGRLHFNLTVTAIFIYPILYLTIIFDMTNYYQYDY